MTNKFKLGFSMIEILVVIGLVAILSVATLAFFGKSIDEAKFDSTYKEMLQIRKALIGELENTNIEGQRVRFGYFGDNGAIPTSAQGLSALISAPAGASLWAFNSAAEIGVGWNGPYIVSSSTSDYSTDAWGRPYIYNTTGTPFIRSYGADGALNGTGVNADITLDLPVDLRLSTVVGQLLTSGSTFASDANVTIYYPNSNGGLTSQTQQLDASSLGAFTFSNIPFGMRTIKVQIPNSASPAFAIGPIIFPVDSEKFFLPEHELELNPDPSVSCNSISNGSYVAGTFDVNDGTNKKNTMIDFQLKLKNAISIKSFYAKVDVSSGGKPKLKGLGINGVYYGCAPGKKGKTLNSDRAFLPLNCSAIDLDINPTITFSNNGIWSIPAGNALQSWLDFSTDSSKVQCVKLILGCDTIYMGPTVGGCPTKNF